jgi:SAM-dependent methyltransferase
MRKCLASRPEIEAEPFLGVMREVNALARLCALHEYTTYSRLWEYPWVWQQLQPLSGQGLRLLDVGSEESPFPWLLASKGFRVTVSDLTPVWWRRWSYAKRQTKAPVTCRLLDAQAMDVPTGSIDIYLSVSVIEHVQDKSRALAECARVLRPGGLLVWTFDICQPEMGMTFPACMGEALSMEAFDSLFREALWFEPGLAEIKWNVEVIPEYWAWFRTTSPIVNYVTGAAVVRRTAQVWKSRTLVDLARSLRGTCRPRLAVPLWYAKNKVKRAWHAQNKVERLRKAVAAVVRRESARRSAP